VTDPNEALAAASAAVYQPFPAFAEWAALNVDSGALERAEQALADLKQTTTAEVLAEAVNTATRSAAVDTGAIEGLYQVDRGFTRTIATEAANWEVVLGAREEETQRAIEDALAAYDFVLDAATGSRGPITEVWIKQLHATICASQRIRYYRLLTPTTLSSACIRLPTATDGWLVPSPRCICTGIRASRSSSSPTRKPAT
jgi:Fic family protein